MKFCSETIPPLHLSHYLKRCVDHLDFDEANFIYMMIYLERYFQNTRHDFINGFNIHRLAFTLLRLGHKLMDDLQLEPRAYSKVGGILSKELNQLEIEALCQLHFELFISERKYLEVKKYLASFAREVEKLGGKKYLVSFSPEDEAQLEQARKSEHYIAPDALGDTAPEVLEEAEYAAAPGKNADEDQSSYYDKSAYEEKRESPIKESSTLVPIKPSGSDLYVTNPQCFFSPPRASSKPPMLTSVEHPLIRSKGYYDLSYEARRASI